jgi:hypothetical protein
MGAPASPGGSTPRTVANMQSDLNEIARWLEAIRNVMTAAQPPHDFVIPAPGWVPGGGPPVPYAQPKCLLPVVSNDKEVRPADLESVLATLRDWIASISTTLGGLPPGTVIPTSSPPTPQP